MKRLKDLSKEEKEQALIDAKNETLKKFPFIAKFPLIENIMTKISTEILRTLGEKQNPFTTSENKEDKIE